MRRGNDSGSVDAFSRALKDEKDPVARGYLENLRSQVATIAARYGANARDVFRADVQDRMVTDDFDRVAKLVRRIGLFSEGAASRSDARDFSTELTRMEREARDGLGEALARVKLFTPSLAGTFAEKYLRADMTREAMALVDEFGPGIDPYVRAKVFLADGNVDAALPAIQDCAESRGADTSRHDAGDIARCYLETLTRKFQSLTDEETRMELPNQILFAWTDPIVGRVARQEFQRRGIPEDSKEMRSLEELLVESGRKTRGMYFSWVRQRLGLAEISVQFGEDPSPSFDSAEAWCKLIDTDKRKHAALRLAETAAKVGRLDLVEKYAATDWKVPPLADFGPIPFWMSAARGCATSGDFDTALEILRAYPIVTEMSHLRPLAISELIERLLDAGAIGRARAVQAEFHPFSKSDQVDNAFLIARARSGENVLAEARSEMERRKAPEILAWTAIATIGFVTAMKKRIEAYANR